MTNHLSTIDISTEVVHILSINSGAEFDLLFGM